nr:CHASE2 domain-containing protein [Acetobacter fallax]
MSARETHRNAAVVTINGNTLDKFDTSFPFSYARHIAVLNQILDARPAAIFVDFRMTRERPGESFQQFAPLLDRARRMGVPLLFARGDDSNSQPALPEPLTPFGVYSDGIRQNGTYPLLQEQEAGEKENENSHGSEPEEKAPVAASPAYALYAALCEGSWKNRCGPFEAENFSSPMVIHWGLNVDPQQSIVSNLGQSKDPEGHPLPVAWQTSCLEQHGFGCSRLEQSLLLASRYALAYTKPTKEYFFPYPLTIGAEQLNERGHGTKEGAPALATLLTDRAVFYGTDLRDQHDDQLIPLLGRMPGAVVHAMAFDNLMVYGTRYFHEPAEVPLKILTPDRAEISEAIVWVLFSLWCVSRFPVHRRWLRRKRRALMAYLPLRPWQTSFRNNKQIPVTEDTAAQLPSAMQSERNRFFVVRFLGKTAILAGLTGAMATIDVSTRETWNGWQNIASMYALLFLLFILTWASPFRLRSEAKDNTGKEEEERGPGGQLLFVSSVSAIGFFINENFLRWPDADWIGLLLLWFAMRNNEDAVEERNKFVAPVCNVIESGIVFLCSLFQKAIPHKNS